MKRYHAIVLIVLIVILSGCTRNVNSKNKDLNTILEQPQNDIEENNSIPAKNQIDLESIKPNENGQIMILMYHGIGENESEFVRTPENFKRDLETLYNKGYRLISLNDYINNDIKTDAGFTPVILTFDDGLLNQFNMIESNGSYSIDPKCAVGIIEEFYKEHPDFGRNASFFVYYPTPFRQKELIKEKFRFLIENGYEIGNHGYNHENLGKVSINDVQKSLALNVLKTSEIWNNYKVQSLALPYGAAPKGEDYKYVVSGEYNGISYHHKAILKVGSNPALPPNHIKFDSSRLPRVRASEIMVKGTGLYDYLEYFEKNPEKRYISDGDKDTITIPEDEVNNIDLNSISSKRLITYDLQNNKGSESH